MTGPTFRAEHLVNPVNFSFLSGNCPDRTFLCAERAALAEFFVDLESFQCFAFSCRAVFILYMGFIFITEMFKGGENRIRRCLPKSAEGPFLNRLARSSRITSVSSVPCLQ